MTNKVFSLTLEKIKDLPIYETLSEEFKKELPLVLETMKENHTLLYKLKSK